jgi:chemotaxis protein CheX
MGVSFEQVREVTSEVWCSLIAESPPEPAAASPEDDRLVTGCVTVSGGWEGAISVGCSTALARRLTAAMFETDPDVATTDEVADAIGELANMIGGNIKGLMPGPSQLSLPAVTIRESGLVIPGCELLVSQSFSLGEERIRVQVLHRAATKSEPQP